jgi:glycerophosphoryl diester phosphodiesterase
MAGPPGGGKTGNDARVLVLAHRGANRLARENTVAAFTAAGALGADGVELDVHLSADGVPVVHHDAAVESVGVIAELTFADLPEWVPTLAGAIDACAAMALVNVEIKDPLAVAPTAAVLDGHGPAGAEVACIVSSFELSTIDAHRRAAPAVPTAWLTLRGVDQLEALATAGERGHSALHPHHTAVSPELVRAAHDRGMRIGTWTVNDPERAAELEAMGVDVLITDVPDVVRRRA